MSVTARPSDSQFSAMEQQALSRWKELQATAAEYDHSIFSPSGPAGFQANDRSARPSPRLARQSSNPISPSTYKPSRNVIIRPDNPLTIEEKLLKMEEPTLCWCKKQASTFDTLEFGVIYECHNLQAFRSFKGQTTNDSASDDLASNVSDITDKHKEEINRSSNSSPAINGSTNGDQVFPAKSKGIRKPNDSAATSDKGRNKSRNQPSNICGFHVHKRAWDQFRSQLEAGNDLDPNHLELNICPAFNLTFCASFRLQNTFSKRFPPVPRCFCNFPVKMLMSNSGIHKNRVTFTCPNFDVDNARPKCSWALIAEEVPFIPSMICTHALLPKDSLRTETPALSRNPPNNASPKLNTNEEDAAVTSSLREELGDLAFNTKDSTSCSVASDMNTPGEYSDARDLLTNGNIDRQGIRWTKDRRTFGAGQHSATPIKAENGADSMAGPSFSSYSLEGNDEELHQEEMLPEHVKKRLQNIQSSAAETNEYDMYNQVSRQSNNSSDLLREHQTSLWKTMVRNKSDHQISEWMTGLDVANHMTARQQFPHPPRVMTNEERSSSNNGETYVDQEPYQAYHTSVPSSYDPNAAYYGNVMREQSYNEGNPVPPVSKMPNQIVPASVYKALMTSKRASELSASKSLLLSTLTAETSDGDQAQSEPPYHENTASVSPGSMRSKSTPTQAPAILASDKSPPYAMQNGTEADLQPNATSKNLISRQLDLMEANFQKSVSTLFLNQRKHILQLQEQMMAEIEGSQYHMHDYIAKLERIQQTLLLENELCKREKLHAEQSVDQMQQVHAEEMDLRRSCQKRTANLEILVAEILQQNERLQQEVEEKAEVAKLSDFKCRVCWHNPITHATIPCYHCGKLERRNAIIENEKHIIIFTHKDTSPLSSVL